MPWLEYLRVTWSMCLKEFLVNLKDPSSRVILLAPVLVQTLLFGYAATFDVNDVSYALVDQSHSEASNELLARLDGTGVFHRKAVLSSVNQLADQVSEGHVSMGLQFASDFADQLHNSGQAPVQLIIDGRNSASANWTLSYVSQIVARFNAERGYSISPVQVDSRVWFNPNLITRWNIVPALIAILALVQTLMLTALSVAREREQGTFDQLQVTPLTPSQILIGKAVPPVLISMVQASIVLLLALFWFHIPMAGSLGLLYLGILVFSLANVGIGLSVSAISATMQQGVLYCFMLLMPMILLSGFATPIENMPDWLQSVTLVNPARFAVDLVRRVYLEGAHLGNIVDDIWPPLLIAVITLPLAGWLFRHRSI